MLTSAFAVLLASTPSVFVSHDKGAAWFITKAISRPIGNSVDGISLADLNAARTQSLGDSQPVCFAQSVTKATFVGLDRQAQSEIEKSFSELKHDPFFQTFSTPDGRQLAARIAIYEDCETRKKGSAIVSYDRATRKIVDLQEWEDTPFRFLWPAKSPALIGHSSCFECGDSNALYYDVTRRKFYWESDGD